MPRCATTTSRRCLRPVAGLLRRRTGPHGAHNFDPSRPGNYIFPPLRAAGLRPKLGPGSSAVGAARPPDGKRKDRRMVHAWFERLGFYVRSGVSAGTMSDHRAVFADDATPAAGTADGDAQFLFVQVSRQACCRQRNRRRASWSWNCRRRPNDLLSDGRGAWSGPCQPRSTSDGLGFTPANPPNAALVAATPGGGEEILVVELPISAVRGEHRRLQPTMSGSSPITMAST